MALNFKQRWKAHVKARPTFRPNEQFGVLQAVNTLFVYNNKDVGRCP